MPPGREDNDGVVLDVADALSLNQRVEWERCEKLVTPANRRVLDNLRVLARVFSVGEAAGVRRQLLLPVGVNNFCRLRRIGDQYRGR